MCTPSQICTCTCTCTYTYIKKAKIIVIQIMYASQGHDHDKYFSQTIDSPFVALLQSWTEQQPLLTLTRVELYCSSKIFHKTPEVHSLTYLTAENLGTHFF